MRFFAAEMLSPLRREYPALRRKKLTALGWGLRTMCQTPYIFRGLHRKEKPLDATSTRAPQALFPVEKRVACETCIFDVALISPAIYRLGVNAKTHPDRGQKNPSGRILIRLPLTLHKRLKLIAERERVSMNTLVIAQLAQLK